MITVRYIIIATILTGLSACSGNTPTSLVPSAAKPSIAVDVNLSPLDRWLTTHADEVMADTQMITTQMDTVAALAQTGEVAATLAACADAADLIAAMRGDAYHDPNVPPDYVGMIDESQYGFASCADMDFDTAAAAFVRATAHTEALVEQVTP